jgi:erythromycin esterase
LDDNDAMRANAAALLLIATFVAGSAAAQASWLRTDLPHVRVYSEGRAVGRDLAAFVQVLQNVAGEGAGHREPCVTVILFANRDGPGLTQQATHTTYLIAAHGTQLYGDIARSYLRAHFPDAPKWIVTGLAETLGTFTVSGNRATVARMRPEFIVWLHKRRHELDIDRAEAAMAWGFTQLLVFERSDGRAALQRYLAGERDPDAANAVRAWLSAPNVVITPYEVKLKDASAAEAKPVSYAEVLVHLGKPAEALKEDPDNAAAHAMLGLASTDPNEAVKHLEAAIRLGSDDPAVKARYQEITSAQKENARRAGIGGMLQRANAHAKAGELSEAKQLIAEVLALNPDAELRYKLETDLQAIETIELTEIYNKAVEAVNEGDYEAAWPLVERVLRDVKDPALRKEAEQLRSMLPPRRNPRTAWLSKNAIDLDDLSSLRDILKGVRVVLLGEQSHGDGATFLAKTRLIKHLHEQLGFDVLAFESGVYDVAKAWELLKAGEPARTAVPRGVFAIWTRSRELQPLIDYIGERAKTDRPLELAGVDSQLTGTASADFLVKDLKAAVRLDDDQWTRLIGVEEPPPLDEQAAFMKAIDALRETAPPFWRQVIENLRLNAEQTWASDPKDPAVFAMRDAQMGRNLVWLAKERYPNRKIIVWAATFHNARNLSSIDTGDEKLARLYRATSPMGEVAHKVLGPELYSLGFTSFDGEAAAVFAKDAKPLPKASANSLEDLCERAGLTSAVIDFRNAPDWLRKPLVARMLGHVEMRADWTKVVDGVVFLRTMTRSTQQ